jgi:hypothetical protein
MAATCLVVEMRCALLGANGAIEFHTDSVKQAAARAAAAF